MKPTIIMAALLAPGLNNIGVDLIAEIGVLLVFAYWEDLALVIPGTTPAGDYASKLTITALQ